MVVTCGRRDDGRRMFRSHEDLVSNCFIRSRDKLEMSCNSLLIWFVKYNIVKICTHMMFQCYNICDMNKFCF